VGHYRIPFTEAAASRRYIRRVSGTGLLTVDVGPRPPLNSHDRRRPGADLMTRLVLDLARRFLPAERGLQFMRSVKTSACRRNELATIDGWLEIVEITVTRTPRRCTASTTERKLLSV
jgi:hypothetical protein